MSFSRFILLWIALISMGISAPLIRIARAPALAIAIWRVGFAWPFLASIALVRRERWPYENAAFAGIFLALHWIAWVIAVQSTAIASAALLICTGTLWSALLSRPVLGEPISRQHWIGLILALAGVGLVVTTKEVGRHTLIGDLVALLGSLAWVGYTFIGRRSRRTASFWGYTSTVYLTAALTILIAVLIWDVPLVGFDLRSWIAMGAMAIFPTLLGHGGLNYLLRFIGPARLGLWTLMEPVLATLIAWPLFSEIPSLRMVAGGIITLAGIGLGVLNFSNKQERDDQRVDDQ